MIVTDMRVIKASMKDTDVRLDFLSDFMIQEKFFLVKYFEILQPFLHRFSYNGVSHKCIRAGPWDIVIVVDEGHKYTKMPIMTIMCEYNDMMLTTDR